MTPGLWPTEPHEALGEGVAAPYFTSGGCLQASPTPMAWPMTPAEAKPPGFEMMLPGPESREEPRCPSSPTLLLWGQGDSEKRHPRTHMASLAVTEWQPPILDRAGISNSPQSPPRPPAPHPASFAHCALPALPLQEAL